MDLDLEHKYLRPVLQMGSRCCRISHSLKITGGGFHKDRLSGLDQNEPARMLIA